MPPVNGLVSMLGHVSGTRARPPAYANVSTTPHLRHRFWLGAVSTQSCSHRATVNSSPDRHPHDAAHAAARTAFRANHTGTSPSRIQPNRSTGIQVDFPDRILEWAMPMTTAPLVSLSPIWALTSPVPPTTTLLSS
jgi:hypothetical protein